MGALVALLAGCPSESDEPMQDTGNDDGGTAATGDGSSGEPACIDDDSQIVWATDGEVAAPMELALAETLGFEVARSWMAEQGTLTLQFSTNCDGPLTIWVAVWDSMGGNEPENADSLYYSIDGGEESMWLYGCSTATSVDSRWWWLPIETWQMNECDEEPLELDLPAGDHTLVLRNRENGSGLDVAAIAAVVVSHDPGYDPNQHLNLDDM